MAYKTYKKEYDYSYSLGVFPTIELLQNRPRTVGKVLLHSDGSENAGVRKIIEICRQKHVLFETNDKLINKFSNKENCYAIGFFSKSSNILSRTRSHIVLVTPGNMGNLGTIIRTAVGFGIKDIGIIRPGVDAFDPKVVRGSMGSLFKVNIEYFDNIQEYMDAFHHGIYTFRLNGQTTLEDVVIDPSQPFALVFGNESSGLGAEYQEIGTGVVIPHSKDIDSLNLSVAVGIAIHHFVNY